jgi:hypothetical protein
MSANTQELEIQIKSLCETVNAAQFNNLIASAMKYAFSLGKMEGYIQGVQYVTNTEKNDEP